MFTSILSNDITPEQDTYEYGNYFSINAKVTGECAEFVKYAKIIYGNYYRNTYFSTTSENVSEGSFINQARDFYIAPKNSGAVTFDVVFYAGDSSGYPVAGRKTVTVNFNACQHNKNIYPKSATCTERIYCYSCGEYVSDYAPHDYVTKYDKTNHWQECSACSHKENVTPHEWNKGVCTACNYVHGENEHTVIAKGEAKEPTCIKEGLTAGEKCSICGKTLAEQEAIPVKPHIDENNDGICDNGCEIAMSAHGVVLNEVSATLKGDIGMNYYITLPQSVVNDDGAYVLFTANNKSTKIMVNDLSPEADGTYKFIYRMNAKEMNDKVAFEVYNSNDNPVDLYSTSGNKVEDSSLKYSLAEYFNKLSSDTSPEK